MTNLIKFIMGVDISKKKFDVALQLPNEKFKTKKFSNDQEGFLDLQKWLGQFDINEMHVCMEATNIYGNALAEYLYDQGYKVSVVNPARIKGFARSELLRTKNDKQDALLIARFCKAMHPTLWSPEALEVRQLKALVRRLDALIEMEQQETNRLDVAEGIIQDEIQRHILYLNMEIKKLKRDINNHIDNNSELKKQKELLISIPGIGDRTAAICLSYFADIDRFGNAKKLASFCGVAPREFKSGTSVQGRGGMSKIGSAQLRKALFMPAMVALKYNPIMIRLKQRLEKNGKAKMVIIGASMRKLIHIIYGVLKGGKPFDENIFSSALES